MIGPSRETMEVLVALVPLPVLIDTNAIEKVSYDRDSIWDGFSPVATVLMKTSEYQTSAATSATS